MADSPGKVPNAGALEIRALGAGRFLVADGTRRQLAYAVRDSTGCWVFIAGRTYLIGTDAASAPGTPGAKASGGHAAVDEQRALSAPMPATVVAVNVAPGQQVSSGDVLIMLEAMKMELPIRAPRAGRVMAVACQPGELVQPGAALVELE